MEKAVDFKSSLKDPAAPIAVDFDPRRKVLLLVFSGLAGRLGVPLFEFNKLTSGMKKINKIYLRDGQQLWYHRGLPNVGDNIDGIATFLRQYTAHQSTQRLVVIGNSAGGYAALLFGHLLQADEVHAFAPKTFIDPVKRIIHRDTPRHATPTWRQLFFYGQRKYFDLKPVLRQARSNKRNFHLYYSSAHPIDCLHATRMKSLPGIHLHAYHYGHHNLIRNLKHNGELGQIIERAIQIAGCLCGFHLGV